MADLVITNAQLLDPPAPPPEPPPPGFPVNIHPTTEGWYESLGQAFTGPDENFVLLAWMDPVGSQLGLVDDIVRNTDARPGWAGVLDPDVVALKDLPWLAQFVGVQLPGGLSETDKRAYLKARPGWERGKASAIKAEAAATLIGDRRISFIERAGSAYRLSVRTHPDDTPDPAATEAAIRRQKPAAIVLDYKASPNLSINGLTGTIDAQTGPIEQLGGAEWENA